MARQVLASHEENREADRRRRNMRKLKVVAELVSVRMHVQSETLKAVYTPSASVPAHAATSGQEVPQVGSGLFLARVGTLHLRGAPYANRVSLKHLSSLDATSQVRYALPQTAHAFRAGQSAREPLRVAFLRRPLRVCVSEAGCVSVPGGAGEYSVPAAHGSQAGKGAALGSLGPPGHVHTLHQNHRSIEPREGRSPAGRRAESAAHQVAQAEGAAFLPGCV